MSSRCWQDFQLFRVSWQHRTIALGISNFEKKTNLISLKNLKKSQKTSHLENYKELSSHYWRQDSQSLRVLWQDLTTGLGISDFYKVVIIQIFWNFSKRPQKTSYLENYKELSIHTWRQDSQSLRVLWQELTTELEIQILKNNYNLIFLNIFEKITKTSNLENYKELSSRIWRQDSQSLIVFWQYPTTGRDFWILRKKINIIFLKTLKKITKNVASQKLQRFEQSYLDARFATVESTLTGTKYRVGNFRFWGKINLNFLKIFWKNHKKRHISKTTRIWTIRFGGKICNFKEYSDSTQLQGCEFEILNNNNNILSFLGISQKTSYLENYNDLSSHIKRQDLRRQCVRWQ